MNVEVTTRGPVPPEAVTLAEESISDLGDTIQRPLTHARVVLVQDDKSGPELPARAEGEVSLGGKTVRGRVEADSAVQAVNQLRERLLQQLRRHIDRLTTRRRKPAETPEGEWRHGGWVPPRPSRSWRSPGERELIRRKSFALDPMSAGDAATLMSELDHDFYLFRDADTDADSVVYRRDDGRLAVIAPQGTTAPETGGDNVDEVIVRETSHYSDPLTLADAVSQMDEINHRFMFFVDAADGRGVVIYLRYDGNYGLIEPAV